MGWSKKYKKSIDCNNPKGFSQKAHCAGRKKQESKMSLKLEELVGKRLTEEQFDEAAGKKDACYHKVKARYDVWPSAYASGALVKCRKVGAKNWGNKSKKEGVDEAQRTSVSKSELSKAIKQIRAKEKKQIHKPIGATLIMKLANELNVMASIIYKLMIKYKVGTEYIKGVRFEGLDEKVLGGKDMTSAIDKNTKITFDKRIMNKKLAGKTFVVVKKGINTFNVRPDGSGNERDTKTLDAPTLLQLVKNRTISKIVNSKGKTIHEQSVNEEKYVVYVDKDGKGIRGRKIVKSGLSQMGAKRLYNKLVKTDDYHEVGYDDHKSWNQNNIEKINEGDIESRELKLYIDNDSQLYNSRFMPIMKNLSKKMKKGKFDKKLAIKGFMYLVDDGAKKYVKDYGGNAKEMFSKKDRIAVASDLADEFEDAYKNKEYSFMESINEGRVLHFTQIKDKTLEKHLKVIAKKVGATVSKISGGFKVDADNDGRKLAQVVDYIFDKSLMKGLMSGGGMSRVQLVNEESGSVIDEGLGDMIGKSIGKYNKKRKKNMDALKKLKKKESVEEAYDIWAEDGSTGYTLKLKGGIVEAEYQGRKVKMNKPMAGDSKKFKVYVNSGKKNKDGTIKVKKVEFGQKGVKIKKSNPERRKSFRARHNCDNPGPKTKARYWSCRKW